MSGAYGSGLSSGGTQSQSYVWAMPKRCQSDAELAYTAREEIRGNIGLNEYRERGVKA